jgi:hypothetical protein
MVGGDFPESGDSWHFLNARCAMEPSSDISWNPQSIDPLRDIREKKAEAMERRAKSSNCPSPFIIVRNTKHQDIIIKFIEVLER